MPKFAYSILRPSELTSSVVFASPHSSSDYPEYFVRRSVLNAHAIRSSEDAFVDQLFGAAPKNGAPMLVAGAPRAFVDLNRGVEELDPALIDGVGKHSTNPRVASGLGVIPRVVSNGRVIYSGKISMQEAKARISAYWQPYHNALQALLDQAQTTFGQAILVDCHSMPHEAIEAFARTSRMRPEIVLGDRFGSSADAEIVERIEAAFVGAGLKVARNTPFAGAYVTQHYGRPSHRQHAVQIEIDRSLYMDEARIEPNANYDEFCHLISDVVSEIAAIGRSGRQLAAE